MKPPRKPRQDADPRLTESGQAERTFLTAMRASESGLPDGAWAKVVKRRDRDAECKGEHADVIEKRNRLFPEREKDLPDSEEHGHYRDERGE